MPMTYSIDVDARLVRIVGSGRLENQDMIDCVSRLRADPMLEPDMNTLSDMRDIQTGFSREGVERMIEVMEQTSGSRHAVRAAIVVSSNVAFGMGRMFELRVESEAQPRFMVFREMADACEWLGIDPD